MRCGRNSGTLSGSNQFLHGARENINLPCRGVYVGRHAQTLLDLDREYGGFQRYLRSHNEYRALTDDLKSRFSYVGDVSAYYFLFRVNEPVPLFARWIKTVEGDHPRIREMVKAPGNV
jgi:hypothetical protein